MSRMVALVKCSSLALVALAVLGMLATPAAAQGVPQSVKIQGFLSDRAGGTPVPANGVYSMVFEIFDAPVGGVALATAGPAAVTVTNGVYEASIASGATVFGGASRYLQVTVNGEVLTPRLQIDSTPYALRSESAVKAETVAPGSVGTAGLAPGAVTPPAIADGAVTAAKIGVPCAEGQILVRANGVWTCATLPGTPQVCPDGSFVACYTGPDGTLNVGTCRAGVSSCRPDRTGFTACVGAVTPVEEACDLLDNDCDGQVDEGCAVCGDGIVAPGEECDDGDTPSGDGCSTSCQIEPGYQCAGQPSVCVGICGDGIVAAGESCDGANLGGQTCQTQGFGGGTLTCSPTCTFDTSGCTGCVDADGDGFPSNACGGSDCNDANPTMHPGAVEICDGVDNDCDAMIDEGACGGLCGNGLINPGEACDGADLGGQSCQSLGFTGGSLACNPNCSLNSTGCAVCPDADGDGFPSSSCGGGDCDDASPSVHPGAVEVCDGMDNDCDGQVDEGSACAVCGDGVLQSGEACDGASLGGQTCQSLGYTGGLLGCNPNCSFNTAACTGCVDADLDGHPSSACGGDDCNDTNATVYPGAPELCDGRDNDCDGQIDEGACPVCGDGIIQAGEACDGANLGGKSCQSLGYTGGVLVCSVNCALINTCTGCADADGDGFPSNACGGSDCNDANPMVHPGAIEICDGVDNDCDAMIDEGACAAQCGDGVINAGEACDGADLGGQTCQSLGFTGGSLACNPNCSLNTTGCAVCPDADGDGFPSSSCGGGDCDDASPSVHPGAVEVCDGMDNDCDGQIDEGSACAVCGDGVLQAGEACDGATLDGQTCQSLGYTGGLLGCNPNCSFNTAACTGCVDADLDGHPSSACGGDDCNDASATVYPGAPELCDTLDNDCDGQIDENACSVCGDGIIQAGEACDGANLGGKSCQSLGYTGGSLVCSASCALINTCTGCADADGDTFTSNACGGTDCNDANPMVHPGAIEICDGVDNDCDAMIDEGACAAQCGDGVINAGEACDGADLGGQSCQTLGFTGGSLACNPNCSFDTAGCTP